MAIQLVNILQTVRYLSTEFVNILRTIYVINTCKCNAYLPSSITQTNLYHAYDGTLASMKRVHKTYTQALFFKSPFQMTNAQQLVQHFNHKRCLSFQNEVCETYKAIQIMLMQKMRLEYHYSFILHYLKCSMPIECICWYLSVCLSV